MTRLTDRLLRWGVALLPAALRERAGSEIAADIRQRVAAAPTAWARTAVWTHELSSLALTALRARWPDAWARRTTPSDIALASQFSVESAPMDEFQADVRFAFRALSRRPMVFGLAVASLALGIGASVAMYSVVDKVLLRPYVFGDPERLAAVYVTWPEFINNPTFSDLAYGSTFAWAEYDDVKAAQTTFTHLGAYDQGRAILAGAEEPQQIRVGFASPGFFQMLDVTPAIGNLLPASGDEKQLALLSYEFWQSQFGGEESVVGSIITLSDRAYRIVGVLPAGAEHGLSTSGLRVWVPRPPSSADAADRGNHTAMQVVGRLRPGVTIERARDEVQRILVANNPPKHGVHGASVYPFQADRTRSVRTPLAVLLAGAGLLLLVACTNVAAILLGIGLERRREISLRGALGATRARIARQLFTESMVLAVVGCALGVVIAIAATRALVLLAPAGVPQVRELGVDGRAILVAVALAAASGVIFGAAPAFSLARRDPSWGLSSARGFVGGMGRGQAAVVTFELALATILLVGGGLLTRTLLALNAVDLGFRADELTSVSVALPRGRFAGLSDDSASRAMGAYFEQVVKSIRAVPGVAGVAVASTAPLLGGRGNNGIVVEGWQPKTGEDLIVERRFVSGNFFQTLDVPMRAGRPFSDADDEVGAAPTMIVSEGLARHLWPGQSAIGRRIAFWGRAPHTVVGVAADIRDLSLDSRTELAFYVPFRQVMPQRGDILVRSRLAPATLVPAIRRAVHGVDRAIAIPRVDPYRVVLGSLVAQQRFRARLMLVFAGLAALFAALGVYGVAARSVAIRTREIGVRVALGAEPRRVFLSVLGAATTLAMIGGAVGVVVSVLGGRLVERLLYGVTATDPWTLVSTAALICAVAVLSAFAPARRATRISPLEALRAE